MMRQKMRWGVCFFLCCVFIVALGPVAHAGNWKAQWKIASLAPDGVGWARQIKSIVLPAVEQVCQGDLKIKTYWGGVMGDDEDYIKKMRIDQLQGAGLSGHGVTLAVPEMAVLELPFLFRSWDEVDYIKTKMAGTFDKLAKKNGYMMIIWNDEDFDLFFSTKHDLASVDQLARVRLLSWFGPVETEMAKTLGMTAIAVSMPESPASLRSGVGDSIMVPPAWMVGTQLYSIARFVSPLKFRYAPAMVAVTWTRWETMPENYKKEYYRVRADVTKRFCDNVRKDNDLCLKSMLEYGMKLTATSKETEAAIRKMSLPMYNQCAGKLYPKELLDEVQMHLANYRSGKGK